MSVNGIFVGRFPNIVGFSLKLSRITNCFVITLLASNRFKKQNKNSDRAGHSLAVFYPCHRTAMVVKLVVKSPIYYIRSKKIVITGSPCFLYNFAHFKFQNHVFLW